jgi:hypothetical protein
MSLGLAASGISTITFDSTPPGRLPSGWTAATTSQGGSPKWQIVKDGTAPSQPNVLAQVGGNSAAGCSPLAILNEPALRDGEISVRFKAVGGRADRVAGLVFRYRDSENYYVARANALANNVEVYAVRNGKRIPLMPRGYHKKGEYAVEHPIPSNVWGTLKVVFRGPVLSVYLNHRRVILAEDGAYQGAGKVGLWTDNDSVTYFDDFQVLKKL